MANKVVAATILALMKADYDLDLVDLRFIGMSSTYTWNVAHDFLDDVTNIITDAVAATGEAVASITGGGNLDCADLTLTTVNGAVASVYAYDHTGGANSARRLVSFYDTGTGLPTGTLSNGSVPLTIHSSGVLTIASA